MKNLKKYPLIYKIIIFIIGALIVGGIIELSIVSCDKINSLNNESEPNYPVHHDCRY